MFIIYVHIISSQCVLINICVYLTLLILIERNDTPPLWCKLWCRVCEAAVGGRCRYQHNGQCKLDQRLLPKYF